MPDIHIHHSYSCSEQALKIQLNNLADQLNQDFQLNSQWQDNCLQLNRKGLKGEIQVLPQAVEVSLHLGILLKAVKPLIEKEIQQYLDQHL